MGTRLDLRTLPVLDEHYDANLRHPYSDYSLGDAVSLAVNNAMTFGRKKPATLIEVREYLLEMQSGANHQWLTGYAALDVLDSAIDGRDIAKDNRLGVSGESKTNAQLDLFGGHKAVNPVVPVMDEKPREFVHAGYLIYPSAMRNEPNKTIWLVQTQDNKDRGKTGFGDSILDTPALARETAERQAAHEIHMAEINKKCDEEAAITAAAREANRGLSIGERKANSVLAKNVSIKGKVTTLREAVEALVKNGAELRTHEEDAIKPMSRMQHFRADQRQQDAHEQRVKDGGKKTVYMVGNYDLGKTAYDYAVALLEKGVITASPAIAQPSDREKIAARYASLLAEGRNGVSPSPSEYHLKFADAILDRDAYKLEFLANGLNNVGKRVFTEVTGIALPKQQGLTWAVIRDWGGITPETDSKNRAWQKVVSERQRIEPKVGVDALFSINQKVVNGFNDIKKIGRDTWLANDKGQGFNMSEKGSHLMLVVPYVKALIDYEKARTACDVTAGKGNVAVGDVVSDGVYNGVVTDVVDGIVFQKKGRDADMIVKHSVNALSRKVAVGDLVDIVYKDGKGQVSGKGFEVEVGR